MQESLKCQFEERFGCKPYPFQLRVCEAMLGEGKNILLHVPTGGGKTLAAVAPFLLRSQSDFLFPDKMVYSFPLRTLVNAVYHKLTEMMQTWDSAPGLAVQTGENPGDPTFLKDMILTTLDQSLSAFLTLPVPVSERQGNINSGALIGSYLVFDEFHLFDPERSLFTTVKMLEMLQSFSRFLIMTATLPQNLIRWLCERLDLELITLTPEEIQGIANLSGQKQLHLHEGELSAEEILRLHREKTLVIVNTVRKAQKLYLALKGMVSANTRLLVLHSRFLKRDRDAKEQEILELFAKEASTPVICIATQVVEVGLDLSATLLLTENAPVDSLIQRIGRLARYANESGDVHIYRRTPSKPYSRLQMQSSWQALQEVGEGLLTHEVIKQFLEQSLSGFYAELIEDWEANNSNRWLDICHALDIKESKQHGNYYRELIRRTDSVFLTIHDQPEAVDIFRLERFQVTPAFLYSCFPPDEDGADWVLKVPGALEPDESDGGLTWVEIAKNQIRQHMIFVANPCWVSYNAEVGLMPGGGSNMSLAEQVSARRNSPDYVDILWQVHAQNTLRAAREHFGQELAKTVRIFQQVFPEVPTEVLQQLIDVTLALHDTGKLNQKWQQKARDGWQPVDGHYSHTANRKQKLPAHAAIGAYVVESVLKDLLKQYAQPNVALLRIITSAVATHHGHTWPAQIGEFTIAHKGAALLRTMIRQCTGFEVGIERLKSNGSLLRKDLLADGEGVYFCYLLLVRLLRLADQHSFTLSG